MAFDIHSNHRALVLLPLCIYVVLVWLVAVAPAANMDKAYPVDARRTPTDLVRRGEEVFKAYGCVVCHTQQIRGDERLREQRGDRLVVPVRAPDARFGLDEPTRAEEYAQSRPPLIGTQRTGPDLTGVGDRLPSVLWHYWHLYDPRSVSPGSVMPPYRYLFRVTTEADGPGLAAHDGPFPTGKAWLLVGGVALAFAVLGWLMFGFTPALGLSLCLGVGAAWFLIRECQLCQPPPDQGEVVEDGIEALGLPEGARLVATPDAKALAEYLLSLKRPVRGP